MFLLAMNISKQYRIVTLHTYRIQKRYSEDNYLLLPQRINQLLRTADADGVATGTLVVIDMMLPTY